MARPKKATVEYFPHLTNHGQTMFILEGRYGNDGYAVFFKILEQLGKTDGHYINCNQQTTWEFLSAYCRVDTNLLRQILNLCASIGAIDSDFWSDGFIFSQNFLDGIKEAYRLRKIEIPDREGVSNVINSYKEGVSNVINPDGDTLAGINNVINPQMKVNEMKVDEIISSSSNKIATVQKAMMMTINDFRYLFSASFGSPMPGGCNQVGHQLCRDFTADKIREAFEIAAAHGVLTVAYVKGVLEGKGKDRPRGREQPKTFEQLRTENNLKASNDFVEGNFGGGYDRGKTAICIDDGRAGRCIPL